MHYKNLSCSGLTTVVIPNSVTNIMDYAFSDCRSLQDVYCYAENIPNTNTYAFSNSLSSVNLHVPAASVQAYSMTSPWKNFGNILALVSSFELFDASQYSNAEKMNNIDIIYTRNFTNTNWQALYVPFVMNYEDWTDDFEVARINDAYQYDDDNDGVVDRTEMEFIRLTSGQTDPNTPYIIKAKSTGEKVISVDNATLYANDENTFDVTSWNTKYTFVGTYSGVSGQEMYDNGYYAFGNGTLIQAIDNTAALKPYRWYLEVTDRNDNRVALGKISVFVDAEEEETDGITHATTTEDDAIYNLQGVRVNNDYKGVVIKNGKKVVVR